MIDKSKIKDKGLLEILKIKDKLVDYINNIEKRNKTNKQETKKIVLTEKKVLDKPKFSFAYDEKEDNILLVDYKEKTFKVVDFEMYDKELKKLNLGVK